MSLSRELAESIHKELCAPDSHHRLCYEAWEVIELAPCYPDRERLEDIKLILSQMHHNTYQIHTAEKVCRCGICININMILNGVKPKDLEMFKTSTEEATE